MKENSGITPYVVDFKGLMHLFGCGRGTAEIYARESGADMTVLFHDNAPYACADFVNKNNVQRIVTGMHDGGNESFLVMFNRFAPMVSITMVAKDNTAYSMDVCKAAVR